MNRCVSVAELFFRDVARGMAVVYRDGEGARCFPSERVPYLPGHTTVIRWIRFIIGDSVEARAVREYSQGIWDIPILAIDYGWCCQTLLGCRIGQPVH